MNKYEELKNQLETGEGTIIIVDEKMFPVPVVAIFVKKEEYNINDIVFYKSDRFNIHKIINKKMNYSEILYLVADNSNNVYGWISEIYGMAEKIN